MRYDENDSLRTPKWRRYLRMIRPNSAADLDDELRDHLASMIEDLVSRGMSRGDAEAEARRRFGDPEKVRAAVARIDAASQSRQSIATAIETFVADVRYGARGLRRSPMFTAVAAISIALGVAANATVFSVVNVLLLRPISGVHAAGLERMYLNHHSPFDWKELAFLRDHSSTLDVVGERYGAMSFRARGADEVERIRASYVTRGFFETLGVQPELGRLFSSDESARQGLDPLVVISQRFWQRRFAGDSAVIGRRVFVADQPVTVVGVVGADFRSSVIGWTPDVFIPFGMAPAITGRPLEGYGGSFYTTVRLKPGVARSLAESEVRTVFQQLARTDSARYAGQSIRLDHIDGVNTELRGGVTAGSAFLMAIVGLVLLIACANVANLMLGRIATRQREVGVRLAIGASRGRLLRQLLTESFMVAALGTALGLAIAWGITRVLPAALPPEAGLDAAYLAPDTRVFLFAASLCLGTTLLCGMLPALRATAPSLQSLLRGVTTAGARRRRGLLVMAQSGMCVLLLSVASYFLRGLDSARNVDPGFNPRGVVDVSLNLDLLPRTADRVALLGQIAQRAALLPGVSSAALVAAVPLTGSNMETRLVLEGGDISNRADRRGVYFNIMSPRYFTTIGTPLARGRDFVDRDDAAAPRVAIVNEAAARTLWPDGSAVGRRVRMMDSALVEIVGVSRDANYVMPGETAKPTLYLPFAQSPRGEMTLQVRTAASVATTRQAVWAIARDVVPELPPPPVVAMSDDMAITLLPVRIGAGLLAAFGAIALILAGAGIYGVASYSVASRTRELGIRAALGATKAMIVRMVLVESAWRVGIGGAAGFVATIAVGFGLSKVLYGVRALDPGVLIGVAALITAVGLVGALAPARRASRADPVAAMRSE